MPTADPPPIELVVPPELHLKRLDHVVTVLVAELSRNQVQRLIDAGRVLVDGQPARASTRIAEAAAVSVRPQAPVPEDAPPAQTVPFAVVFEDEHLVVVDKPAGLVVHPGAGRADGTLVNGLIARFGSLPGSVARPGVVHRLDRGTSGLMLVARSELAWQELSRAIAERRVERRYQALVWGTPEPAAATVEAPIARSRRDRRKMCVSARRGRPAVTHYATRERFDIAAYLDVKLETGRTHQIRVHLQSRGYPVLGDPQYAGRHAALSHVPAPRRPFARSLLQELDRQALHAIGLSLDHPATGERLSWESALPSDFQRTLDALRAAAPPMSWRPERR